MDLNYLYHRHQFSLFMSDHAQCEQSRGVHRALADAYASRISDFRRARHALGMPPQKDISMTASRRTALAAIRANAK